MNAPIVQSFDPVSLIGGGDLGKRDLEMVMTRSSLLVAADGGAAAALRAGYMPEAVIGDFDSLSDQDAALIPSDRLFPVTEQDSTDFDKALRAIEAPVVLAVGFLGGRVDHQLAALHTLVRHADRPCILIGAQEVIFHAPPRLDLPMKAGDILSLFPMATVTGRSTGLEWPIDGLQFAPDSKIGTSNRATGAMQLHMDGPGMLVIAPRTALNDVIRAVARQDRPADPQI